MEFRLNSKIWPWSTLPLAGICLLLAVSLLRTISTSGGDPARWSAAAALGVLSCLNAVTAVLLHRTYRRELLQRARAEAALRESESRYRELFDHVAEGLYQSSPSGEILAANPALVSMLGFESVEELRSVDIGKDLYVDPGRRAALAAQLERDGYLRGVEYELRRRDGRLITVTENARVIRDEAGAPVCYEGSLIDITPRKEAERAAAAHTAEVESAREQLEQQARQLLEQSLEIAEGRERAIQSSRRKSEFLAHLSREFRAPMNGVVGMAQLLLESHLSPQQREFAESVKRSAARLLETIDDILELARIENNQVVFQKAEFSLRSVVADVLHRMAAMAEAKGLDLAFLVQPGVPDRLVGDSVRIRQVLGHLVQNAIRFTGSGEVTVTVTAMAEAAGGLMVRFQVEDSGIGIETEAMPMLFEPFAAPPRPGGTSGQESSGLALAISRKLVERMGGQMGVESEPGQGSLFWFQLRLAAAAESASPAGSPLRGRRALVIDDSAVIRGAIAELLSGQGMYAVSAAEPRQALQILRLAELRGEPFDFALIDHDLPELSGIALAQTILDDAGCGRPKLILLVPYSQRAHCSEPVLEGIAGTLAKPIEEAALANALLHCLDAAPPLTSLGEALRREDSQILVIEDNTVNQHVIKRLIGKLGHESTVVADAETALSLLRERRFAVILMDCHLPGMDGFAAASAIRATEAGSRRTPIIAMTADALPGDRERCLSAGMDDYLAKPISFGELRATLGRWLDRSPASVSV